MIHGVRVTGNYSTWHVVLTMPDGTRIAATADNAITPYIEAAAEAEARRWVRGTVFCESANGSDRVQIKVGDHFRYFPEPQDITPAINLRVTSISPEGEVTLSPVGARDVEAIDREFPQTEFVRGQPMPFRRLGNDLIAHEAWTCWAEMEYRGGASHE